MRPGIAPTYVRRWPRMSASSRAPPSATRTYSRPSERAIDLAIDVLPTPGGPTNSRIGPFAIARAFASFASVIGALVVVAVAELTASRRPSSP